MMNWQLADIQPPTSISPDFAAIAVPVILGLLAIALLLPRPRMVHRAWGAATAALALLAAGWLLVWGHVLTVEVLLFYVFSGLAILSGGLLITQVNPVHAALSFALVVLSTCGLFLLQAAPFLMAATTIVYAGAIIVTFLFVIMLAQQEGRSDADHRSREPVLASVGAFVLLGALLYVLAVTYDNRHLAALVDRAALAAEQPTMHDVLAVLGNENLFFDELQREAARARGAVEKESFANDILDLRAGWGVWVAGGHLPSIQKALKQVAAKGALVRDSYGCPQPHESTLRWTNAFNGSSIAPDQPWENVAPLGRVLFTDYLVAVELAGTLLLAATIGAIAIAGSRREVLR
jgi:NADH:ubiquinone oxidoreductase subunit 6 (subunit J)